MFARFAPVFIALLAVVGAAAAGDADSCKEVCCQSAGDATNGWQGSDCQSVGADGHCSSSYKKLCCYDIEGTSAADCAAPENN